jgi:cytoskeletal protein RodZ
MPDSLGARLRYERERRQISLPSIAERTKIGVGLLQALERDDVSRWPGGIFRKSFVRSYAEAIGLNADEIVREFSERHPDPAEIPTIETTAASHAQSNGRKPLSVRLTIRWNGSLNQAIGRLADWKIVRMLLDFRL